MAKRLSQQARIFACADSLRKIARVYENGNRLDARTRAAYREVLALLQQYGLIDGFSMENIVRQAKPVRREQGARILACADDLRERWRALWDPNDSWANLAERMAHRDALECMKRAGLIAGFSLDAIIPAE